MCCLLVYLHFVDCHHVLLSTLRRPLGFVPANHRHLRLSILDQLCDWRWSHFLGPQPFTPPFWKIPPNFNVNISGWCKQWMSERNHLMFWCVKLCGNLLPIASMKLLLLPLSAKIASCTERKRLLSSYPSVFLSSCTHLPVLSSNLRVEDSKCIWSEHEMIACVGPKSVYRSCMKQGWSFFGIFSSVLKIVALNCLNLDIWRKKIFNSEEL